MLSSEELTERIVAQAKSLGASLAGIASVESLKDSPSHKIYPKIGVNLDVNVPDSMDRHGDVSWPKDAVSAVVIGIEHDANNPELDWWDGKGTPGNRTLIRVNNQLAEWIEKTFAIKAYKLPYFIEKGGVFLKDAAVNAGLGCMGKNNLVITPEYGPRIRFRALLLNREGKVTHQPEFNPCRNCGQPCRKACPVNAFQTMMYSPQALGQSTLPGTDGTYNRVACNLKMEKDIDDAARMITTHENRRREIRQLISDFEKSHIKAPIGKQSIDYCVKYCRKCELSCPIGIKA